MSDVSTPLQKELVSRIVRLVHEDELKPGARLNELRIAQRLNVSRTPVRAALEHLASQGFVERRPNRGVELVARPPLPVGTDTDGFGQELIIRISKDRREDTLPREFTESFLARRYNVDRKIARDALEQLEQMELIERKRGYGWRFPDDLRDTATRKEGYRFRILLECGAILEPNYEVDQTWADDMRIRHERYLSEPWTDVSSIGFFEMNASFHEGVCAGANNRFVLGAIRRQNRLRRLSNYNWKHGYERVVISCRQHLEILDRLESKENDVAAALMRHHLEGSRDLPSPR